MTGRRTRHAAYVAAHRRYVAERRLPTDDATLAAVTAAASAVPPDFDAMLAACGHPVLTHVREFYGPHLDRHVPWPDDAWTHGTRATFVSKGCRCWHCVEANRTYAGALARRHAQGRPPGSELVDGAAAHARLRELQRRGVGLRVVSELTGVSRNALRRLRTEPDRRTTPAIAAAIAALDPAEAQGSVADGALVDAAETWRLIDELLAAGLTRTHIARAGLGARSHALQLGRERVTAANARAILALHDHELATNPAVVRACRCEDAEVVALTRVRLDAAPLLERVAGRGGIGAVLTAALGPARTREREAWRRAYYRIEGRGWLTADVADRIAAQLLGVPMELVWDHGDELSA